MTMPRLRPPSFCVLMVDPNLDGPPLSWTSMRIVLSGRRQASTVKVPPGVPV
ncbi:hypothetical protein [Actinoallomurus iriomotensis]|uniref:hypothetical protein n=1 Tax=Actinoallomurus iriomotensis TaxID=478107 RepID=UPI0025561B0A|nr:hypothetical protein [Actinoallomurus iriomotensis]